MRKRSVFLLIFYALCPPGFSHGEKTATELVDEANKLLRGQSSRSQISMVIRTPKWERTLRIEAWNQGREKALMRIHAPAKERGNGTLKIGKELWNWLPSVERVIKIPPSMMHTSWMGSDFTYEDVVKADSVVKDYTHRIVQKKMEGGQAHVLIEAIPKPDAPVVWGKVMIDLIADGDRVLPFKEEDYSERGEQMRTISFSEFKTLGGRFIPTRLECTPLKKSANKTVIVYHDFVVDVEFPKDFFGLATLQKPLK